MPIKERVNVSLEDRFEDIWSSYSGKKGGFISERQESEFKKRGEQMIEKVVNSDFLEKPSTVIEEKIPNIDLIPEENIKLVGSLDWIQVMPDGGFHIVDFKTGKSKEKNGSLQLPIYNILASEKLEGKVKKISYWYLESDSELTSRTPEPAAKNLKTIKNKALEIKRHVKNNDYPCHYNGRCFACGDYHKIFNGQAEFLGTDSESGKDLYFILKADDIVKKLIHMETFDPKEEKVFELRMEGLGTDKIMKELRMSEKKIKETVSSVKKKMVGELTPRELKIIVEKKLK